MQLSRLFVVAVDIFVVAVAVEVVAGFVKVGSNGNVDLFVVAFTVFILGNINHKY